MFPFSIFVSFFVVSSIYYFGKLLLDCHFNLRVLIELFFINLNLSNISVYFPAKPGRVVGPVLPYESGQNINGSYDSRVFSRNGIIPPQGISPHYVNRTNTVNQEKSRPEVGREYNTAAKPSPQMAIDINSNPYYHQPQVKSSQLNDQIAMNAKLLQEQSQLGAIGAAAVAAAARREVGAVQFGLS